MKSIAMAAKGYTAPAIREAPSAPYSAFEQIDGRHPWKNQVPAGYVEYEARVLRKVKVAYFNFALAEEMGLLPKGHPHRLNPKLEKKLVQTFALRIINEYDILNGIQFPSRDKKPNKYMATRYLQLQHISRLGHTSGDGRSLWNGCFQAPGGKLWDISSCGTGVTRLSPASAYEGKPIRSGDTDVAYGSGLADLDEGLSAAILSESFHSRGLLTERTLVLLSTADGHSINVRAAQNLLRPSHLFLHLKQGNQLQLKAALDYYIEREALNGLRFGSGQGRYDAFLKHIASGYGEFAARLEDEYIFCWLDWDGDNMLTAGGIIDYGSIRQFGLCHHHYRYDDIDRYSTNLSEQKAKALYLAQTFVQLVDFVQSGEKKSVRSFRDSTHLKVFEDSYNKTKKSCFLRRMGWGRKQIETLLEKNGELVDSLLKRFEFFERKESPRGMHSTPDGINCPALFDARNLLRELPKRYLLQEAHLTSEEFIALLRTPFCTRKVLAEHGRYKIAVERFQKKYLALVRAGSSGQTKASLRRRLLELAMRASQANPVGHATGDGIIYVVDELLKQRKKLGKRDFLRVVEHFIAQQCGRKEKSRVTKPAQRVLQKLFQIIEECRYSI